MRTNNHFRIPLSVEAILFSVTYFAATAWAYAMLGH
jgi:hypothetical protein